MVCVLCKVYITLIAYCICRDIPFVSIYSICVMHHIRCSVNKLINDTCSLETLYSTLIYYHTYTLEAGQDNAVCIQHW